MFETKNDRKINEKILGKVIALLFLIHRCYFGQYYTILYSIIQYYTILYNTYYKILYSIKQYHIIVCNISNYTIFSFIPTTKSKFVKLILSRIQYFLRPHSFFSYFRSLVWYSPVYCSIWSNSAKEKGNSMATQEN